MFSVIFVCFVLFVVLVCSIDLLLCVFVFCYVFCVFFFLVCLVYGAFLLLVFLLVLCHIVCTMLVKPDRVLVFVFCAAAGIGLYSKTFFCYCAALPDMLRFVVMLVLFLYWIWFTVLWRYIVIRTYYCV